MAKVNKEFVEVYCEAKIVKLKSEINEARTRQMRLTEEKGVYDPVVRQNRDELYELCGRLWALEDLLYCLINHS